MNKKSQVKKSDNKTTSKEVASIASKVLKGDRFSKTARTLAGSALAQAKSKKK